MERLGHLQKKKLLGAIILDKLTICTPPKDEQCWKKPFLKKIREEYNVIFDGKGCLAVRILDSERDFPLVSLMIEDDGALHETDCRFSMYWADGLIKNLEETMKYCKKQQKKKQKTKETDQ